MKVDPEEAVAAAAGLFLMKMMLVKLQLLLRQRATMLNAALPHSLPSPS